MRKETKNFVIKTKEIGDTFCFILIFPLYDIRIKKNL